MISIDPRLKERAILLRKRGKSYGEIKQEIPVAKSTLSTWLKSVPLAQKHRKRLYTKRIRALNLGPQSQRERRSREVSEIIKKAKGEGLFLKTKESYALFGAALYWAEGSKSNGFAITNSDPCLIVFTVQWLRSILGILPERLTLTLNLYPQQDEVKLKKFWSEITGVPLQNFRKSFVKPPNKHYKKNTLYYGTCKLRVSKGTDLRYRIFGWIQGFLEDLHPELESAQKRWGGLREVQRPSNM